MSHDTKGTQKNFSFAVLAISVFTLENLVSLFRYFSQKKFPLDPSQNQAESDYLFGLLREKQTKTQHPDQRTAQHRQGNIRQV